MRTIKFRAWMKDLENEGEMVYFVGLNPDGTCLVSFDEGKSYDGDFVVGEDLELMQFTGLLDKNGKEIYEGDLISIGGMAGEVVAEVKYKEAGFNSFRGEVTYGIHPEQDEILGNIYENPSLLTSTS